MYSPGERRVWRVWRMCWTFTRNPMTQSARWSVSTTSKQLLAEKRSPIPPKPARRERYDYEYQRNGTRNLFMLCEPLAGWRHVAVTERRTMVDFAQQMRWLADEAYPASENPGGAGQPQHPQTSSLYETFEPKEARRIRKRLEFHYTPKHGSWLNMAEIEFNCLGQASPAPAYCR